MFPLSGAVVYPWWFQALRSLQMPDEEGFSVAGELQVGGFLALEADLGEALRPLAGFGRDLEGSVSDCEPFSDDWEYEQGFGASGWVTGPYMASQVRYVSPDQVECWGLWRRQMEER